MLLVMVCINFQKRDCIGKRQWECHFVLSEQNGEKTTCHVCHVGRNIFCVFSVAVGFGDFLGVNTVNGDVSQRV